MINLKRLWNKKLKMWEDDIVWQEWDEDLMQEHIEKHYDKDNIIVINGYFNPMEDPMEVSNGRL